MKSSLKKTISLIITLALTLSMFSVSFVSAYAESNTADITKEAEKTDYVTSTEIVSYPSAHFDEYSQDNSAPAVLAGLKVRLNYSSGKSDVLTYNPDSDVFCYDDGSCEDYYYYNPEYSISTDGWFAKIDFYELPIDYRIIVPLNGVEYVPFIKSIKITQTPTKKDYVAIVNDYTDIDNVERYVYPDFTGMILDITLFDGSVYKHNCSHYDDNLPYEIPYTINDPETSDYNDQIFIRVNFDYKIDVKVGKNEVTVYDEDGGAASDSFYINVKENPYVANPVTKLELIKKPDMAFSKASDKNWYTKENEDEIFGTVLNDNFYNSGVTTSQYINEYSIAKNMNGAAVRIYRKDGSSFVFDDFVIRGQSGPPIVSTYRINAEQDYPVTMVVRDIGNYQAEIILNEIKTIFTANKSTVAISPNSVKLTPSSLTLGADESYVLTKTLSPSNANAACTWSSSNESVAYVINGNVYAEKTGTATITVKTANGKTATCKVTVKPAPKSVKLSQSSITLGVGESYTISESTNSGSYANAANLKWSSSNSDVATVTKGSANKATIKAKKVGTATVTIKLYNGKTATCKVTVKPAPASVKLSQSSIILGVGESYTISESTNSGSYANSANLKWISSNSGVASVTKGSANKATIKAKKVGTATVTIKLYNGKTATCKVTVKPAPKSVKLSQASITLGVGESYTISECTNSGSYANSANLKWSSSNSGVASVTKGSANKATITAKKVGTATVTIKLYNGKTATCKVTVKSAPKSVKLSRTSITLKVGERYTISESTNSGSYANAANLKWSSSNPSVASVAKGSANKATITAKKVGTATVTIKLYNGKTATCKVTVK